MRQQIGNNNFELSLRDSRWKEATKITHSFSDPNNDFLLSSPMKKQGMEIGMET